jgi:putative transposase
MLSTPGPPPQRYGLGAVNYHPGETVVIFRRHQRRREMVELLPALLERPPPATVSVAWDKANPHEDEDVEAVVRGAAGRLVLLSLPTDSPGRNPLEMRGRPWRREVTHGEWFETIPALLKAAQDCFQRYNQ